MLKSNYEMMWSIIAANKIYEDARTDHKDKFQEELQELVDQVEDNPITFKLMGMEH